MRTLFAAAVLAACLATPLFSQSEGEKPKEPAPLPDLTVEFDNVLEVEHLLPHLMAILTDPGVGAVVDRVAPGRDSLAEDAIGFEQLTGPMPQGGRDRARFRATFDARSGVGDDLSAQPPRRRAR